MRSLDPQVPKQAGCIIGHHEANKHARERERAYHEGYDSGTPPYDHGDGYGPR